MPGFQDQVGTVDERSSERMNFRIKPRIKRAVQRAAALSGVDDSVFTMNAAYRPSTGRRLPDRVFWCLCRDRMAASRPPENRPFSWRLLTPNHCRSGDVRCVPIVDLDRRWHPRHMTDEQQQVARDEWQTALYEASYRYSAALKELHRTNPWPEHPALATAISILATELWDRCFRASDILAAFENAVAGLPAYTAGDDIRP